MNTRIWIIVILILIVGTYAGFAWFAGPSSQTATSTNSGNPFGGSGGSSGGTGGTQGGLTIPTKDGGTVTVPDFTQSAPSASEGSERYYYLTNNADTQGASAQYDIQYGTDGSVTVSLLSEPIGTARLAAEEKLRSFFPLSNDQLCSLDVIVGVPNYVNSTYSGNNLGLSFCPGSTPLPQ